MRAKASKQQRAKLKPGRVLLLLGACSLAAGVLYWQRAKANHKSWVRLEGSEPVGVGLRRSLRKSTAVGDAWPEWSCPLDYQRTSYKEVQQHTQKPYLLGGAQRPVCINCHKREELWSNFCQFESQGPTCNEWDQQQLLNSFIQRADEGALGMKEMLSLTPCDLFQLVEGRTLWLVGDSMTQELQRALQCFFYEFWELQTHEIPELIDKAAASTGGELPAGCNYGEAAVDEAFPALPRLGAVSSDLLLLNFGAWHNDLASFNGNLSKVARHVAHHRGELPFLLWREVAPQHFDTPLGEFGCDDCPQPAGPYVCKEVTNMSVGLNNELTTSDPSKRVLMEGGWRNKLASPVMTQLGVPILQIWNHSMPLWQYHHNFQVKDDCTHMCHPSAYQLWIYLLYELLLQLQSQLPATQQGTSQIQQQAQWRVE